MVKIELKTYTINTSNKFMKLNLHGSLISRLKNHDKHSALITIDKGELRRWPGGIHLESEEKDLIHLIVEKKGYFIGTKPYHLDRGKYLSISTICDILEENPDWIRIKKISNKFGL